MHISNRKLIFLAVGAVLLVLIIVFALINAGSFSRNGEAPPLKAPEKWQVRGDSLYPLVSSGTIVTVSADRASLQSLAHNDLVTYNFSGDKEAPLIKIIKGVPGDRFGLKPASQQDSYHLLVNGETVKNSEGKPYVLDRGAYKLLSLYVNDYKGVLPPDVYIILGNDPRGSVDSTRFGLVNSYDMGGKVLKIGE